METGDEQRELQTGTDVIKRGADEKADFERAMLLTGYGRYNISLLFVCGFSLMAVGFQNGLSAYILSSAECDLELTSGEMGMLNAAFLIGGTASAMLWGVVADGVGRKKILVSTLLVDGVVTLFSSSSQSFPVFFIFRFISGFVVGAPGSLMFSYIGEFHSESTRAKTICYLGFFWTVSWLLLPVLAWIIIPLEFSIRISGFLFNSWRLFVGVFGVPSLISALLLSRYPETPKFLLSQGKKKEALKIMRNIFVVNTDQSAHEYPVTALISDPSANDNEATSFPELLGNMWKQLCCLFSPPLLKYNMLCSTILFCNVFGYYGLGLWLPELFNRFEAYYKLHPNASVTVCELSALRQVAIPAVAAITEQLRVTSNVTTELISELTTSTVPLLTENLVKTCDGSVNPKVFINTITIGAVCLVGNFVSGYLADRVGRRTMPIATMIVPGLCGCLIYFLRSPMQNLIVSCIFSSFIATGGIVLNSIVVDIFPTNVNAMAICAASFAARFGAIVSNLLFGLLLDIKCEIPIFLVGGVVIFGGLLGFYIPKHVIGMPQPGKKLSISG